MPFESSSLFSKESDVVGSHGGWKAPQSVPKDNSTGFESIDAYFDSDDEPNHTTTFDFGPQLRNDAKPQDIATVSTPFKRPSQPSQSSQPSTPSKPLFERAQQPSPLPAAHNLPEDDVNARTSKPAAVLQDDGYGGEYNSREILGTDNDYEEQQIQEVQEFPDSQTPGTPERIDPASPIFLSSPYSDEARTAETSPTRLEEHSSGRRTTFKRLRGTIDDDEGGGEAPPPPMRFDVPIESLDAPEYQEKEDVLEVDDDSFDSDAEGSVIEMIVPVGGMTNEEFTDDGLAASSDDSSNEGSDQGEGSDSDEEVEEIELVSVSSPEGSPKGPRRSSRNRVPTLDTWRGEYVVYSYDPETGTRTAEVAHTVEPDRDPVAPVRKQRRRQPITVLSAEQAAQIDVPGVGDGGGDMDDSRAPLFGDSIKKEQLMAQSLNRADDTTGEAPFPDAPRVSIQTILGDQENMPVVIAQLTFGRSASIPPRNSGDLWYTFICWTGKLVFKIRNKSVVLQREGAVTVPAGHDFFIENLTNGPARILMIQAQTQNLAEEYSRINGSRLTNFDNMSAEEVPGDGIQPSKIIASDSVESVGV